MNVELDLSAVNRLADELAAVPKTVTRVSSQKMTEIAGQLRDDARAAAPVDTGALRDSIVVQGGADWRIVKATARHAFFVEFGTSDTPPQPYMWPAAGRAGRRLADALAEIGDPFST